MISRSSVQKRLAPSIRFQMKRYYGEIKAWDSTLIMPLVMSLTGLKSVRLRIVHDLEDYRWSVVRCHSLRSPIPVGVYANWRYCLWPARRLRCARRRIGIKLGFGQDRIRRRSARTCASCCGAKWSRDHGDALSESREWSGRRRES